MSLNFNVFFQVSLAKKIVHASSFFFFFIVDCTNESYRDLLTVAEESSTKQIADVLVEEQQQN